MEKSVYRARRRKKGFELYADGLVSRDEWIVGLLESFETGNVAKELATDPMVMQEQIRTFIAEYWPSPLPRVFFFGDPLADNLEEIARVRQDKYAELAAAIGLGSHDVM